MLEILAAMLPVYKRNLLIQNHCSFSKRVLAVVDLLYEFRPCDVHWVFLDMYNLIRIIFIPTDLLLLLL